MIEFGHGKVLELFNGFGTGLDGITSNNIAKEQDLLFEEEMTLVRIKHNSVVRHTLEGSSDII